MGKYDDFNSYKEGDKIYAKAPELQLLAIANELAEANRLKRIEIRILNMRYQNEEGGFDENALSEELHDRA